MKLIALAAITFAASSATDNDDPHRSWGQVATLDMTLVDATACIAREQSRKGRILILPVEGGNDIDVHANVGFGTSTDAWKTFQIRQGAGVVTMRALYRRPYKLSGLKKEIEQAGKRCLRITDINPT